MPFSISIIWIFAFAIFTMVAILLGGLIWDMWQERKKKKSAEQQAFRSAAVEILNRRLARQIRQQNNHIATRDDSTDELFFDKIERYQDDFPDGS